MSISKDTNYGTSGIINTGQFSGKIIEDGNKNNYVLGIGPRVDITGTGTYTKSLVGNYVLYSFTSGTATIQFQNTTTCNVLIVGGGGGGGAGRDNLEGGGGGGGGGVGTAGTWGRPRAPRMRRCARTSASSATRGSPGWATRSTN